ncbi:MAG: hypothetical protein WAZ94_15230 [Phycisphaerales bacterium]|nr:hypothetical protein [Chloroflexota bacterium]
MEPQKRIIDGYTVELSPLPAWQGLEGLHQLTRLVGPALTGIMAAAKGDLQAIGTGVSQALMTTPPAEVTALMKRLLGTCRLTLHDGKQIVGIGTFDTEFQGKLLTVFKIVAFAVEVNYGDFFGEVKAALGKLAASKKLEGPTPPSA